MAAYGVGKSVLYMDADIYFEPASFAQFLAKIDKFTGSIIAVTRVKTEHCVYVHLNEHQQAISFSRTKKSEMEWANLAWLPRGTLIDGPSAVFEQLSNHLPIQAHEITSFEVDTLADLELLQSELTQQYA